MKEILGKVKSVHELLGGAKFAIDYYQREYRWRTKQVIELIDDLTEKFMESHEPENGRNDVANYSHYYLGSIIISDKDTRKFIIDGQQRLTTLTLLLIHIYRGLNDVDQKAQIANLILSQKFGERSFNLDVSERTACMETLFTNGAFEENGTRVPFEENGESESVSNIRLRFQDIQEQFPEELSDKALPYFADWLIENVHLVEITAYSDADAYTIFETMNDRGLSLTPTDMLKGYLLAKITDANCRNEVSRVWRERVTSLQKLGKEEDADAIKAWLRSQYAQTIRERKRGAQPLDFDLIATEFHRWVHDHEKDLSLTESTAFADFIKRDFAFYTGLYERIRQAGENLTEGLESIHYNAQNNFTLQYTVLLSSLRRDDKEKEIRLKLSLISTYLDILLTRRIWNSRAIDYSTMQYAMFLTMRDIRDIRGKKASELVSFLINRLKSEEETFSSNDRFRLHGGNGKRIHSILARMTDYIETQSGRASRYKEYIQRSGKNGYEVEHIWADHFGRHSDEFTHPADFSEYRNRIGGLLLLPKSFNASYGDKPYAEKRNLYYGQNLLAQSLHENAYENDPGFRSFRENSGLPFQAHTDFKKADLDTRQELYRNLAERIWNPENLRKWAE